MLVTRVRPSFAAQPFFTELDNLLSSVANQTLGQVAKEFTSAATPAVNIKESTSEFLIQLAAPGLNKEDFSIMVEKNTLKVSAKKEVAVKEGEKIWRKEFSFQQFERQFNLPDTVSVEKIGATYEQGILTISLEKKPEVAPKNISIN
jgi:HSP20 family protein